MAQPPEDKASIEVVAVPATPPPQTEDIARATRSPSQKSVAYRAVATTPPASAHRPINATESANVMSTPTTTRKNASKDLPSLEYIDRVGVDELRQIAKTLVSDLTDARITGANARLQHHLLLLETKQAAERAEVESQLSRRQVDFLRVKQNKSGVSRSPAVQPSARATESLTKTVQDLENQCEVLEELCEKLKREKDLQDERIQSLSEHNALLVTRIRENREHFTRIREHSPQFATPREAYTTPRRKYSRYQDDTPAHGPFAALIAADQILSQETVSVSSTPTKLQAAQFKKGHTRGAHSLSSIQTPHNKDRPNTSDGYLGSQLLLSAPASQFATESALRERHDRDSTISISDQDGNNDREGVGHSQASSLAADMLRNNPHSYGSPRLSQDAEKSSTLLQSKLFGNVKKPANEQSTSKLKRQYGFSDSPPASKKVRTEPKYGLGIEA